MSDEEDFDELPSITVNSSFSKTSWFSMPSAEQLATERAREEACERELLLLRAQHDTHDTQCGEGVVSAVAAGHSDSSGSEGEAALAAAVGDLRVRAAPPAPSAPAGLPLLEAVLPRVAVTGESDFLAAYVHVLREGGEAAVRASTDELTDTITGMVAQAAGAREAWGAGEVLQAGAWLCAAAAAPRAPRPARRPARSRRAAARALHLLIDDVATDRQVEELSSVLAAAAAELEPGAALELSDALRSGSERSLRLARALAAAALRSLAPLPPHEEWSEARAAGGVAGAWRRLPPPRRYLALQLLARLPPPGARGAAEAEGEGGGEARRVLEALAQAPPGSRHHSPDTLKVLVAATKLQVLFHVNK